MKDGSYIARASDTSGSDCTANGGVYQEISPTLADQAACEANSMYKWKEGAQLVAAPMASGTSCSTGPSHADDSDGCLDPAPYLADALAGKTASAASGPNAPMITVGGQQYTAAQYYNSIPDPRSGMSDNIPGLQKRYFRAIVTNAANVVSRASLSFNKSTVGASETAKTKCFGFVYEPMNKGKIEFIGNDKSDVYLVNPKNYAAETDFEKISVQGGDFTVLAGDSAGPIDIATTGKVRLFGLINSGAVTASGSQDIVIANTTSSGTLVITDVSATLLDITNEAAGRLTVNGPTEGTAQGGKYKAYDIVNRGTVTVNAGQLELHTVCPTDGTIELGAEVQGTISYEAGCMGTIQAVGGGAVDTSKVMLTEMKTEGKVITGEIDVTVDDPDAFIADAAAKQAVTEGIAEVIGVPASYVVVTLEKGRRLKEAGGAVSTPRRLAGTVKIKYTVTIPASESASVKSAATANAQAATASLYQEKMQTKLTAAGSSVTITVDAVSEPTTAQAPAPAPPGTASSAPMAMTRVGVAGSSILFAGMALGSWM
jgi:hypothetical protein